MMDGELRENMGRKLERAGGAERGGTVALNLKVQILFSVLRYQEKSCWAATILD